MQQPAFSMRAVYECGWNVFHRKGFSTDARDIAVNYRYLDHLAQAGINWLVVFWANGPTFEAAWKGLVSYAHDLGIKVARGVYGFSGGGEEYTMAEPGAPEDLLRESKMGPKTALCPHEEEAEAWLKSQLSLRLNPSIDGLFVEPAREIGRNCTCFRCASLLPYDWDVFVLNTIAAHIRRLDPDIEIVPYVNQSGGKSEKKQMATAFTSIDSTIKRIVSWGSDTEGDLIDWLESSPRFCAFTKLARVLLFPQGLPPVESAEARVARVFNWCKLAAERGKDAYVFDYRIFGGVEWQGHHKEGPTTRISSAMPASLGIIGAAMQNPWLDRAGQRELIQRLHTTADWDLDSPQYFYRGQAENEEEALDRVR